MAKDDVEIPAKAPRKRRQLEGAPDLFLATWLANPDLVPGERRRLEDERKRRAAIAQRGRRVIGFVGELAGMTPQQRLRVGQLVAGADEAHHGDCIGATQQFHSLCRKHKVPIVSHPPSEPALRAWLTGVDRAERALPHDEAMSEIVREATVLIAAPKEAHEPAPTKAQGAWSLVRYARKRETPTKVVMPDGQLLGEETQQ